MKTFLQFSGTMIVLCSILTSAASFSWAQPKQDTQIYNFTLDKSTGPVRQLHIELDTVTDATSPYTQFANLDATLENKSILSGVFTCKKPASSTEVHCVRDDGGGEFFLITRTPKGPGSNIKPEYVLRFHTFNVSDEDDKDEVSVTSQNPDEDTEIIGEKQ